jgi:hypothetical protein
MGDAEGSEMSQQRPGSEPPERDLYWDDSLPGQPLSVLVFCCSAHGEEKVIDYYDPADPPCCGHGDLMTRKAR